MNANLQKIVKWPYFHPLFSEAKIESNGTLGIAQSGVNLAVWATAVGLIVYWSGGKHPYRSALITLGVFVAAEALFGASGDSSTATMTGGGLIGNPASATS